MIFLILSLTKDEENHLALTLAEVFAEAKGQQP
jgi:hypothetical protein